MYLPFSVCFAVGESPTKLIAYHISRLDEIPANSDDVVHSSPPGNQDFFTEAVHYFEDITQLFNKAMYV